jgi:hypothetical protein
MERTDMMIGDIKLHPTYRAAELAAVLTRVLPKSRPDQLAALILDMQQDTRAAKRHALIALRHGKEGVMDHVASQIAFAARLASLGAPTGTTVEFGGDPRGSCGRLIIPGVKGDGLRGDFPIY